jgi:hypothetical protein
MPCVLSKRRIDAAKLASTVRGMAPLDGANR